MNRSSGNTCNSNPRFQYRMDNYGSGSNNHIICNGNIPNYFGADS